MNSKKLRFLTNNLKAVSEINTTNYKFFYRMNRWNLYETFRSFNDVRSKLGNYLKTKGLARLFQEKFTVFPVRLSRRNKSENLVDLWPHQRECLLLQKLRNKGHQMFGFTKLWEEKNLKNLITRMKSGTKRRNAKGEATMMFGSVSLLAFDWDKFRIQDKEIKSHSDDFNYIYTLREKTLCHGCHRKSPKENSENVCHCDDYKSLDTPVTYDNWEIFVERKDLVVWRRLVENGHYEYKVYGSYNDVSAEEFLNVQVDTTYRRTWDTTAIVLDVIEHDPDPKNNTDVIYWEMLWPMMFANRDYVFIRRYSVDYDTRTITIVNKSISHPKYPEKEDKVRVKDYWSYMVVKPYSELNKHGIEFVLTYYDNPGVNIPSKMSSWVAMRAMPDFLERLRDAAKKYKAYCKQYGVKCICLLRESLPVEEEGEDYLHYFLDSEDDLVTDNTISEAQHNLKKQNYFKKHTSSDPPKPTSESSDSSSSHDIKQSNGENPPTASPAIQRGTKHFWRYLNPSYYIS